MLLHSLQSSCWFGVFETARADRSARGRPSFPRRASVRQAAACRRYTARALVGPRLTDIRSWGGGGGGGVGGGGGGVGRPTRSVDGVQ